MKSQKCGEAREYPLGVLEYSSEEYSSILGGILQYSLRILTGVGYGFEGCLLAICTEIAPRCY